ncbi:MAG TPA: hypothetical protein PLC98_00420, partial [Anaerolineales bacterium]|nr:hypothetical protein [Anaerolineales bacterium]
PPSILTPTTASPTLVPDQEVKFVLVRDSEGALAWMDLPVKPGWVPSIGLQPRGGAGRGAAVLLAGDPPGLARYDASVETPLAAIVDLRGLAVQTVADGGSGRLAWGARADDGQGFVLVHSAFDASDASVLLTANQPIAPVGWSAEGAQLYYALEPEGVSPDLGYPAASSLYRLDLGTGVSEALVPFDPTRPACIDDLAPDALSVVERCGTVKELIIRYLGGPTTTIQAPPTIKGDATIGSARFSPDGRRVAFALTSTGLPDTISWVAVSDGLGGGATQLLQSGPNEQYAVVAWLSRSDLLVQGRRLVCDTACESLYVLNLETGNRVEFALGAFVAFAAPTSD